MARIRTIKPSFFRSIPMSELPISTRMTYIGLWTYVDDEGRGVDDTRLIKSELWPLDAKYTLSKVEKDLALLHAKGLIIRYSVGTRTYLAVPSWTEHQKINRPYPSSLPDPSEGTERPVDNHGSFTEHSLNDHGVLTAERKGKERKGTLLSAHECADDIAEERSEIVELCQTLADHVGQFLGDPKKRPKVTQRWYTDMRLLLDRGPLGRDAPEEIEPKRVMRCMEVIFTQMSTPEKKGFCWAAQVRSPHALREHWDQIAGAWQRMSGAKTSGWQGVSNGDRSIWDDIHE